MGVIKMKRLLILYFVFCILCSVSLGDNDFGDVNCVALWRLENGALTVDSKGGNTLTNDAVVADAVNYKEGEASGDFEWSSSAFMTIADADLDAGFPLKDGDSTKKISVCAWIMPESLPTEGCFFAKWDHAGLKRQLQILQLGSPSDIRVYIGYNGGVSYEEVVTLNTNMVVNQWYHIGFTFQDSDKSWRLRVWDESGESVMEDTGNTINNINIEDSFFTLGCVSDGINHFDGRIDEVVVFNDILTSDEIDQIRVGTYGVAAGGGGQVIIIYED